MPGADRLAEYRSLRAAVGQRTAVRVVALVVAWIGWAALATVVVVVLPATLLLLVPLVLLWAAFELNLEMIRGIEQLTAYLRVFYEERAGVWGWETAAADLGGRVRGSSGGDGLQFWVFAAALVANYLCVMLCFGEAASSTTRERPEDTLDLALASAAHLGVLLRFTFVRQNHRSLRGGLLERLRARSTPEDPSLPA